MNYEQWLELHEDDYIRSLPEVYKQDMYEDYMDTMITSTVDEYSLIGYLDDLDVSLLVDGIQEAL